jgi:hypothetical protein
MMQINSTTINFAGGDNVAYHMFYDKLPKKYIRRLIKLSHNYTDDEDEDEDDEDIDKYYYSDPSDYDTLADVM